MEGNPNPILSWKRKTTPIRPWPNLAYQIGPFLSNLRWGITLQLTVSNQFPLKYFQAQGGGEKLVGCGEAVSVGDGDEIRFAKGAPFPKIRFIFPGWEDPRLKEAKTKAAAIIDKMVERAELLGEKKRQFCNSRWTNSRRHWRKRWPLFAAS